MPGPQLLPQETTSQEGLEAETKPKSSLLWDFMLRSEIKCRPLPAMLDWINSHEDPELAKRQVLSFSWIAWRWAGGDRSLEPDLYEWDVLLHAAVRRAYYHTALATSCDNDLPFIYWSPGGPGLPQLPVSSADHLGEYSLKDSA